MNDSSVHAFSQERKRLNDLVMVYANRDTKRFWSLDSQMYQPGALDATTKELLGLVSSLVLRCDDCIRYHVERVFQLGVAGESFVETMNIGLLVGGSIVIPHFRRAIDTWENLVRYRPMQWEAPQILSLVDQVVVGNAPAGKLLLQVCEVLRRMVGYYDWVGFYIVSEKEQRTLELGPFVGKPTEHVKISFGEGICGQAAEQQATFIVQDVSKETNYLSCSADVRSEILAPVFFQEQLVGELDIDSHSLEPFGDKDQKLLEAVAQRTAFLLATP